MNVFARPFFLIALGMLLTTWVVAEESEPYIKVEIKGTLRTRVMAIGGETTGTIIQAGPVAWELDFGDHKDLRELASQLDRKQVIVTGTYHEKRGVEVRVRRIVAVASLKAVE